MLEEINHKTNGSPHTSQQKPGVKLGLPRMYLWKSLLLSGWILVTNREDPQGSWEWQYQQKYCQCGLKGAEKERDEKRLVDFQNPTGRKWANKTTQLKTHATLCEQRRLWGQSHGPGKSSLQPQIILMSWNPKCLGTSDPLSFLLFSSCLNRNVCIDYSTPVLPVYSENR